jgi:hypothetical protein
MGAPGRRVRRDGPAASWGARVSVRRRPMPGAAPTSTRRRRPADVDPRTSIRRRRRRRRFAFASSVARRRAARPRRYRQAAHGGAPWRSNADTARRRRSSPRAPVTFSPPSPKLATRRRADGLPHRRPPHAWERRGVASDATAPAASWGARVSVRRRPMPGGRADVVPPRSIRRRRPADIDSPTSVRRRRFAFAPRRPSRARVPRAPTRRQAAHGGAPWRSHADTARRRRSSARTGDVFASGAGVQRAPVTFAPSASKLAVRRRPSPKLATRRRADGLPHRRPPRAWERRGVASDATARRPRGGRVCPCDVGRCRGPRRRRPAEVDSPTSTRGHRFADVGSPTSVRRRRFAFAPRRPSRAGVPRAPTCRQAAHGGAPWRSHADTARRRRSSARAGDVLASGAGVQRAPVTFAPSASKLAVRRRPSPKLATRRRADGLPHRRPPHAWERRGVASDATARRPRGGAGVRATSADAGGRADVVPPTSIRNVDPTTSIRRAPRRAPRRPSRARVPRAPTCRQAAHGGAPWRSNADTARRRRSSARTGDVFASGAGVRRAPAPFSPSASEFARRRPPRGRRWSSPRVAVRRGPPVEFDARRRPPRDPGGVPRGSPSAAGPGGVRRASSLAVGDLRARLAHFATGT